MSVPEDHHFLPKFYLSRWVDPGIGELWEYSRPHDKVVVRRRSPKGTGKQRHLYSIIGEVEPKLRQQVELRLMSPLDDRAARALEEMINTRARPESKELRDGWARFVMSLLHRSPRRIAYLENLIRTYEIETTPEEEEAYAKLRAPNDPPTLKRLFADGDASRVSRSRAVLLRSLVDSENMGNVIVGMRWGLIQINQPKHRLLTCDDPVLMSNGLNHERAFFALPVAPDLMFLAVNHPDVLEAFNDQKSAAFEAAMNDAICLQADRLVLGQTNQCLRFVENRLQRGSPPHNGGVGGRYTWSAPIA